MDIFFNELSIQPYTNTHKDLASKIKAYALLIKNCFKELKIQKVRYALDLSKIDIDNNLSLYQYCVQNGRDNDVILILTTKSYPYIDESDEKGDDYINNKYEVEFNGTKMASDGFACAYLNHSFCVGFQSSFFTSHNLQYIVYITTPQGVQTLSQCYCLNNENDFQNTNFLVWAITQGLKIVMPVPKPATVQRGGINVGTRGHHGTVELTAFAKKIINDRYVLNVLHSLPFLPSTTFYHGATLQNGRMVIKITLYKYPEGFSMAVETTAKDEFEAKWIADRLEDLYY